MSEMRDFDDVEIIGMLRTYVNKKISGGGGGGSYDDTEIKQDIADIWKAQGELGAKNLLPYPYDNTTKTSQGINWVVNDDGSVTVNGTATGFTNIDLHQRVKGIAPFIPNTNRYIASLKNGDFVSLMIALQNVQNGTTIWQVSGITNTPKTITFTDEEIESIKNGVNAVLVRLYVNSGKTVDNVTVYPMIRLATDLNNDWQPYVMTNQTLTKIVRPLQNNNYIEDTDYAIQNWMQRRYRDGEYLEFNRKTLDHAIVTFSIDDSYADVSAASDLFIQKGVPLCLATIPSKLSQVCDNGDTVLQTCLKTQNNGGEILTHNSFVIDANSNSQDYFEYFVTSKRTLEQNGLKVKGIIKAGGGTDDPSIETVLTYLRSYYDYGTGFQYVTDNRYGTGRFVMTDTLDNLKARVDAVSNGGIVNFYCHGSIDMGNDWITKITELIDYIQSIPNAEIVTIGSMVLNNYIPSFIGNEDSSAPLIGQYLPTTANGTAKKYSAQAGATTATFNASGFMAKYSLNSTDLVFDVSAETANGVVVPYNAITVTSGGVVTVTFDALEEAATFICRCSTLQ